MWRCCIAICRDERYCKVREDVAVFYLYVDSMDDVFDTMNVSHEAMITFW